MTLTTIDNDQMSDLNAVKDIVLNELYKDKIITEKQCDEYASKYNIILIKPKWFSKVSNFFKKHNDDINSQYIKIFKE